MHIYIRRAIKRRVNPNLAEVLRGSAGGTCKKHYANASILILLSLENSYLFYPKYHSHSSFILIWRNDLWEKQLMVIGILRRLFNWTEHIQNFISNDIALNHNMLPVLTHYKQFDFENNSFVSIVGLFGIFITPEESYYNWSSLEILLIIQLNLELTGKNYQLFGIIKISLTYVICYQK